MIVAVLRGEAEGACLWGFCGESGDGGGQPEGFAVEGDGGEVDRGSAEDRLISTDGIRDGSLDVGDLHCGRVDDESSGGAGLDGGAGGWFCGGFARGEGEGFGAGRHWCRRIGTVVEALAAFGGEELGECAAEASAERDWHVQLFSAGRLAVDRFDLAGLFEGFA